MNIKIHIFYFTAIISSSIENKFDEDKEASNIIEDFIKPSIECLSDGNFLLQNTKLKIQKGNTESNDANLIIPGETPLNKTNPNSYTPLNCDSNLNELLDQNETVQDSQHNFLSKNIWDTSINPGYSQLDYFYHEKTSQFSGEEDLSYYNHFLTNQRKAFHYNEMNNVYKNNEAEIKNTDLEVAEINDPLEKIQRTVAYEIGENFLSFLDAIRKDENTENWEDLTDENERKMFGNCFKNKIKRYSLTNQYTSFRFYKVKLEYFSWILALENDAEIEDLYFEGDVIIRRGAKLGIMCDIEAATYIGPFCVIPKFTKVGGSCFLDEKVVIESDTIIKSGSIFISEGTIEIIKDEYNVSI